MLQIKMEDPTLKDIKYLNRNKSASGKISFPEKQQTYNWIKNLLKRLNYNKLTKKEKGEVLTFLISITDYEPSYIRKIVSKALKNSLKSTQYQRSFTSKIYSAFDVKLLAKTDIAHQRLNGHATKHIMQREHNLYGKNDFENIAHVSVSHLYRLRTKNAYDCVYKNGTKARLVDIGITEKPKPNGRPGSIRVDTVHQRDIYYINAVDEITQWELIFAVPKISELFLEPILEYMLQAFPFVVFNFHSDRGSEYINKVVAKLLNKLIIRHTKSRSRHSNDQALVECKNGVIIRKHMGYGFIAEEVAPEVNKFCIDFLNPYLNFHRPCGFVNLEILAKENRTVYDSYLTPFEKLQTIPNVELYLKEGVTIESLKEIEMQHSDNEFAVIMQKEKRKLYKLIYKQNKFKVSIPNSDK